jgi:hypothetical protein
MEFPGVTFVGPEIDDQETWHELPDELRCVLGEVNGFIAYRGGLHVRGACRAPAWHSLATALAAFAAHYDGVHVGDVPFAQDAVGDQWLLREGQVLRLHAEFGRIEPLGFGLDEFLARAETEPLEALGLHPLLRFRAEGGSLQPGQLLDVVPPFVFKESANGVRLRAVPTCARLDFLADLTRRVSA